MSSGGGRRWCSWCHGNQGYLRCVFGLKGSREDADLEQHLVDPVQIADCDAATVVVVEPPQIADAVLDGRQLAGVGLLVRENALCVAGMLGQ